MGCNEIETLTSSSTQSNRVSNLAVVVLITVLITISGVIATGMRQWNIKQIDILLQWAAEKEGRALHNRIVHESELSPMLLQANPELLQAKIKDDENIVAAGIMSGATLIASYSNSKVEFDWPELTDDIEAVKLNDELTFYIRSSGPGGRHGASRGPQGLSGRRQGSQGSGGGGNRISIYFVFRGPDRAVIQPLVWQKNMWPAVWLIISLLWLTLLVMQARTLKLRVMLQKESHLSSIGRMSARLAHEIKNPLGAIRGMAQMLSKKLTSVPDMLKMTETIESETFRLEELTRSILDFARQDQCSLRPLNPKTVAEECLRIFNQQFDQKAAIKLEADDNMAALGDDAAIRQIMLNLLKNALDESQDPELIKVTISRSNHHVALKVYNRAEPLAEQTLEEAFSPFYSSKTRGYGLGLPISRRLAAQMKGSLRLYNSTDGYVVAELKLEEATENV